MELTIYASLAMFFAGIYIGVWYEARLWRRNATTCFRKESGGKLYKVIPAEDYDDALMEKIYPDFEIGEDDGNLR